jgi:RNA polymerase sigma-70 factor, ECF subfamily
METGADSSEQHPGAAVGDAWRDHHRVLVDVAYRMLGSLSDAEDAVSEAFIRLARADLDAIDDLRGWLVVAVSRICLDQLGSARVRREAYIGQWLPEPVVQTPDADPADRITLDESVRMALLVVLERMTPAERVTYVLHEVFGYTYAEIAEVIGRTPESCRQLAVRARRRLRAGRVNTAPISADHEEAVCEQFLDACRGGDPARLLNLLDPEVVMRSDGGGRVTAARRPVVSADAVINFVRYALRRFAGASLDPVRVNGGPGFRMYDSTGSLIAVVAVTIDGERVNELDVIVNPDKLALLEG